MCERGISQIRKLETEAQRGYISAQSHRATKCQLLFSPRSEAGMELKLPVWLIPHALVSEETPEFALKFNHLH